VPRPDLAAGLPRVRRSDLVAERRYAREEVALAVEVRECLVDVARTLRADPRVVQGASTRSLVLWMPALQARALLHGRDYVTAEDVAELAPCVFGHRIETVPGVEEPLDVVRQCARGPVEALARAVGRAGR
jgi:MoxR-like ATPase